MSRASGPPNPDGSGRRGTASAGGGGRRLAPVRLRPVHRQHPQRHFGRPVRRRGRQSGLGRLQQEGHSAGGRSGDQGSAAVGRSRRPDRPLQGRVRDRSGGPGRGAAQGRQRRGRVASAAGRGLLQRPAQALDHHRPDRRPDPPDRPGRGRPHPGRDGDDQGPGRLHRLAAGLLRLPEDRSALPVSEHARGQGTVSDRRARLHRPGDGGRPPVVLDPAQGGAGGAGGGAVPRGHRVYRLL